MFLSLVVHLGMAGDGGGWVTWKGSALTGGQVIGTPHWSGTYRVQLAAQDGAVLLKRVILCCVILCALCSWALQALFLLSTGKQSQDRFFFLC